MKPVVIFGPRWTWQDIPKVKNALEAHVVDGVNLNDALEEYGRGEEMAGDLNRDQVIADAPAPPERIIDAADGYSADEIAALQEFMSDQEVQ